MKTEEIIKRLKNMIKGDYLYPGVPDLISDLEAEEEHPYNFPKVNIDSLVDRKPVSEEERTEAYCSRCKVTVTEPLHRIYVHKETVSEDEIQTSLEEARRGDKIPADEYFEQRKVSEEKEKHLCPDCKVNWDVAYTLFCKGCQGKDKPKLPELPRLGLSMEINKAIIANTLIDLIEYLKARE